MPADAPHAEFHRRLLPRLRPLLETPPDPGDDQLEATTLLEDALRARATDIHLDPHQESLRIRLRIDGRVIEALRVDAGTGARLTNQFKVLARLNPVPSLAAAEGSFSWPPGEEGSEETFLRVTAVSCVGGEKMAVRFLAPPESFRDTLSLGIGEQGARGMRRWMDATGGMLLVAGPTGSGKTTTLYTLLNQLRLTDSHVITLEDPVEYEVPGINQIQVDEANGLDFATGTRSLLRLDPDYVLIGEIRDPDSARAALNVAGSGRSLMGTLHSRDAVGVVSSLRHLGLGDAEISANLGLVVAQRLVRRLCEHCRERQPLPAREAEWLKAVGATLPASAWMPVGCDHCDGLGFRGRTGVFEVWQPTPEDHGRILRHADESRLRRALVERGEPLMFADGLAKAEQGITSLREVLRMGAILAA
ncbi:type II secretory ATPase GspE/PulE/Tfp pilus assembly ATPase PilB-like protein [Halomonas campaniensis]|uniref:Type II secretory ATPase GspE/PulE/Tfp pilus assembly ATPase PilB-like protein n=1 Tax=Halomonas campaniensis TaxID=213554 RepID=A0A7W5K4Y1_9GAMM|nr:GspE/PulE family protein [Halomonas campaniensis]MBB3331923.1 type II secretory ATPase GspE/PulE/Tfp pilus assembly ATPase PilB-like protein [Halomonas campaniensis]